MKMWSLQSQLFTLCIALSCVTRAAGLIHVFGYEGTQVNVSCTYGGGYESYEKYLCKNDCSSDDVLIKTTETKKNKYFTYDDQMKRVFTTTISNLSLMDAGKYWCGVTRMGMDIYTEVKLEVQQEWCCVTSNSLSGTVGDPVTMQCPYPPQHVHNRKFLCKGDHRNNCTDMVSSQSPFTLQEDVSSSSFSVKIGELTAGDAATYWCGSDPHWSVGNYTKIHLSVVFPQQTSTVFSTITVVETAGSQSTHIRGKPIKDAVPFHPVVFGVSAALLILIFVLVIVCISKRYKVQGAGVNVNINKTKAAEAEEVISVSDIYENQDAGTCSKPGASKAQSSCDHYNDADEDQSVYQNFDTTEDIYCNQMDAAAYER